MAISKCGEQIVITAPFENVSERKNTLHVFNTDDETQNIFWDELSEMSVPWTHFDRQPQTHRMVTGQTTQTNQIAESLTRRVLTPHDPPSQEQQTWSEERCLELDK